MFKRVVIFGDTQGIPCLLEAIPKEKIVGIVLASNRLNNYVLVKELISGFDIPILTQPNYLSSDYTVFYHKIKKLQPDCLFCNSYSMLIKEDILQLVNDSAFNIHASYLSCNRGPNPIQWAIIKGQNYTGVTIHCMDTGFDTGNIVHQLEVKIDFKDTWVSLGEKLAIKILQICKDMIPKILNGNFSTKKQDETFATKNYRLTMDYPKIDFNTMTDVEIYNLIRAQIKPLKGAYVVFNKTKHYLDEFHSFESIPLLRKLYMES